ncbi:hypothetical protein K505DRAFT_338103 [Melanomma pulvis-pyrius CBS 109.77]|uniref:Uncharacterized protein n=1 Tax=Melanomma pulvis-pyrius CBS 109.77 TaxID=1314802 RepID=A0A6A6X9M4_9PLEO|nr:hypothetical protein K505DRAFT_338103 [Melanomma pulvis-pyrius CBS 109.77]
MAAPEPSPEHLMVLCRYGDHDQLLRASTIGNSPSSSIKDYVPIDWSAGAGCYHLFLRSLLEAATTGGHADTAKLDHFFGQPHCVAMLDLVTPSNIAAALRENTLEVLLKFKVVEPDDFFLYCIVGSNTLSAVCYGGPHPEPVPRRKDLNPLRYMMESAFDPNGNWVPGLTRSGNLYRLRGASSKSLSVCWSMALS